VVVDDTAGSDPRVDELRGEDGIRVIEPPFNLGHQRAIVYGLRSVLPEVADEDTIVTMDSDGEDRPEDLPRLLEALDASSLPDRTPVIAMRTRREETLRFRVMYVAFRVIFRTLTGVVVRSGNYAAYRGALARRILPHPHFDLCYSSTLISLDLPVVGVPCARGRRLAGQSRMNFPRLAMHGVRMLMPFTDRVATRALIAFSLTFALSIVLAVAVVGVKLVSDAAIPGWATSTLIGMLVLSFVSLGNFIVLITIFSQSRGVALQQLDRVSDGQAVEPSHTR
jgi:hypothetical protein